MSSNYTNKYDEATARLREDHLASVHETASGWRWACTCGSKGRGSGTATPAGAQAAMNRHLQAEYQRLLEQITEERAQAAAEEPAGSAGPESGVSADG